MFSEISNFPKRRERRECVWIRARYERDRRLRSECEDVHALRIPSAREHREGTLGSRRDAHTRNSLSDNTLVMEECKVSSLATEFAILVECDSLDREQQSLLTQQGTVGETHS